MTKSLVVPFLAVSAFFAIHATDVLAGIMLPTGLPVGSQYQLVFVTADLTTATSSDITYYNNFVATEAAENPLLPSGVTWTAIISTATVNAIDNAPSDGLPVFNTAGGEVATAGLYTGTDLLTDIKDTQFGTGSGTESVWTGTYPTGVALLNATAGNTVSGQVVWGQAYAMQVSDPNTGSANWICEAGAPEGQLLPLYALSSPITVVPEPPSLGHLGFGAALAWGCLCESRPRA